jgi:hypothetical protein
MTRKKTKNKGKQDERGDNTRGRTERTKRTKTNVKNRKQNNKIEGSKEMDQCAIVFDFVSGPGDGKLRYNG